MTHGLQTPGPHNTWAARGGRPALHFTVCSLAPLLATCRAQICFCPCVQPGQVRSTASHSCCPALVPHLCTEHGQHRPFLGPSTAPPLLPGVRQEAEAGREWEPRASGHIAARAMQGVVARWEPVSHLLTPHGPHAAFTPPVEQFCPRQLASPKLLAQK